MPGPPYINGRTIEIWRASDGADEYGNPAPGVYALSSVVHGCGVAPRKEVELDANYRQGVIVGWTVYAPAGTDVRAHDRVVMDETTYDIDGEPGVWQSPLSGWYAGVEINLHRVEG